MIHPDSDTLEKFFDRELSDEQNVSVERHVAICSECRDFLVGSQMTRTLLESSPLPTQSESFVHSVMEKVRDSEHQRFAFQIRNFFEQWGFQAGGLAFAALLICLSLFRSDSLTATDEMLTYRQVELEALDSFESQFTLSTVLGVYSDSEDSL